MTDNPTSPEGRPITIRPIEKDELGRVVLRCWPDDPNVLDKIFEAQGTIGMAAWEGDRNVAQLHCYRIDTADGVNGAAGWKLDMAGKASRELRGAIWCHECCHVGRTLETTAKEGKDGDLGSGVRKGTDPRYFGRGIGTAMVEESIKWAREHDYAAILAAAAPDRLPELAVWMGRLPWTTYAKLGFKLVLLKDESRAPDWTKGGAPPEVMSEIAAAIQAGRPENEIREPLAPARPLRRASPQRRPVIEAMARRRPLANVGLLVGYPVHVWRGRLACLAGQVLSKHPLVR